MRANYKLQRLFLNHPLIAESLVNLDDRQSHYLSNVLRMKQGDKVLLFNGCDGEWLAEITEIRKKQVTLKTIHQERQQPQPYDLMYCFAPLKHARLDYMVQKAVEMGASVLQPVLTQYTQVSRINGDRIEANIIEAAEQCGILSLAKYKEPISLEKLLDTWEPERRLIFCDEASDTQNPIEVLKNVQTAPLAVLIGPEGGFSDKERSMLRELPFVITIPLGPRILRADTAAVAALAVVNAVLGDWRD